MTDRALLAGYPRCVGKYCSSDAFSAPNALERWYSVWCQKCRKSPGTFPFYREMSYFYPQPETNVLLLSSTWDTLPSTISGDIGGCFTNVSRALQNDIAKIHNATNHIYGLPELTRGRPTAGSGVPGVNLRWEFQAENFLCAQSMGTRTKFQLGILIRSTISAIHKFRENILEGSRNVSEITPRPCDFQTLPKSYCTALTARKSPTVRAVKRTVSGLSKVQEFPTSAWAHNTYPESTATVILKSIFRLASYTGRDNSKFYVMAAATLTVL